MTLDQNGTSGGRADVVREAQRLQRQGAVIGWSFDDDRDNYVTFFVPLGVPADRFPLEIGRYLVVLEWIPLAEELSFGKVGAGWT